MYATYPAILDSLLPGFTVLADTDNDVEAVVTGVETLTVTLRAVTDESKSVVLEVVLELSQGPVASLVNNLLGASKVKSLDTTSGNLYRMVRDTLKTFLSV